MLKDAASPAQQTAQETFDLLRQHIEESHLPVPSVPRDVTENDQELQFLLIEHVRRDRDGTISRIEAALVDYTDMALSPMTSVVKATLRQSIYGPGVDAVYTRKRPDKTETTELTNPFLEDKLSSDGLAVINGFKTYAERFTHPARRGDPREI